MDLLHSESTAEAVVLAGACGALLPLVGLHVGQCRRIAFGHVAMAITMIGMLYTGAASTYFGWVAGSILVVLSFCDAAENQERALAVPCVVDMTAMGLLMLFVRPAHKSHYQPPSDYSMKQLSAHHGATHAGLELSASLGPMIVVGWGTAIALILLKYRSRNGWSGVRVSGCSAMMLVGMVPMIG